MPGEDKPESESPPRPHTAGEPPVFKKTDVLRDFRKSLAAPNKRNGKGRKPAGGNPRFR